MATVKLGDIAIEAKSSNKGDKTGIRTVGLEHLTPSNVTLSSWSEDTENTFTKEFSKGDVLFGRRRAYLKKAAVAPFDGICSGDITVIRAIEDKVDPNLLPFIIQNDFLFDFAVGKSAGSLSPRVKWTHLKEFAIEIPSMPEQSKLAETLWSINETKNAYEDLINKTDELVKSQFIEMFGDTLTEQSAYEVAPLSSVFDKPQGGEWGKDDPDNTGVPVLRTTNFTDEGIIDFSDVATRIISLDKVEKKSLSKGDILIEKSGGSSDKPVGRVVYFESDDNTYLNNNFTAKLHLNGIFDLNPFYVFKFMFVNYWMGGTKIHEGKTTGIHNIRLNDYLEKTYIPLAPRAIQDEYVEFAEESDKSKFALQEAIKDLDALSKKIIAENLIPAGKE